MLTVAPRTELLHLLIAQPQQGPHHVLTGALAGVHRGADVHFPVGIVDIDFLLPEYALRVGTFTATSGVVMIWGNDKEL